MKIIALSLALVAASSPAPEAGRTLTVGPGGQYATVQAAADQARPGDTVRIAPGTYTGGLKIKRSGTTGSPITFIGRATIKGALAIGSYSYLHFENVTFAGSTRFDAHADGAHDLTFRDFGVNGSQDGGLVLLNTSNVLVDGCEIRGTNARGTKADHEAMSVADGSRDVEVRRCNVHDNGEEGIDVKYTENARVKIHDNVVRNNRGPNIYVDSASDVEVYNNIVSGTHGDTKAGIALAVEDWAETRVLDNVKVYNNVSYGNKQAGLSIWVQSTGVVSNVQIVNNTFYGNAKGSISFDGDEYRGVNILRNNVFEKATGHEAFVSDHNVIGDPGFVNPREGDFHLRPAASRAIDKGSAENAPAFDLDGKARPWVVGTTSAPTSGNPSDYDMEIIRARGKSCASNCGRNTLGKRVSTRSSTFPSRSSATSQQGELFLVHAWRGHTDRQAAVRPHAVVVAGHAGDGIGGTAARQQPVLLDQRRDPRRQPIAVPLVHIGPRAVEIPVGLHEVRVLALEPRREPLTSTRAAGAAAARSRRSHRRPRSAPAGSPAARRNP